MTTRTRRAPTRRHAARARVRGRTGRVDVVDDAHVATAPRRARRRCRGRSRRRSLERQSALSRKRLAPLEHLERLEIPHILPSSCASARDGTSPRRHARSGSPGTGTRSRRRPASGRSPRRVRAASRASASAAALLPRSERTLSPARRRRSPSAPPRTRACSRRTRRTAEPATARASHSARRAEGEAARTSPRHSRRASARTLADRAALGQDEIQSTHGRPYERLERSVTSSCQIGAETSSRRSSSRALEVRRRLDRQEAPSRPAPRHLEVLRRNERGDLVVEPLELHGRAAFDVLQHVEPGQVVVRVERVDVEERRVRVEDRHELLVERRGESAGPRRAAASRRRARARRPCRPPSARPRRSAAAPQARCAPTTTGSTRAPRLSTFETVTSRTPRSRSASSVPERRSAWKRSP